MKLRPSESLEKRAERALVRQRDESDCGVACLASIIRYFDGDVSVERLRNWSGTTRSGTTLLGLFQAGQRAGMNTSAFEGDVSHLESIKTPSILHILKDGRRQHYVVCFGWTGTTFLIGDPSSGTSLLSPTELSDVWRSGALLTAVPGELFVKSETRRREKWQWLRELVRDDTNVLVLAFALGIIVSLLGMSTAVFSQTLVDRILPSEDRLTLVVGVALLTFLLIARSLLAYLRQLFLIGQSRNFNNRVIGSFFYSLLGLPQPFFDSRKVGDLIARMNDTQRLQRAVTYLLGDVLIDVLILVPSATVILLYSRPLGMLALTCLPIFGLLAFVHHRPILVGQQQVMAAHSLNESNYVDAIQGIAAIKVGNREAFFHGMTISVYALFQQAIYGLGRLGIRLNVWIGLLGTLISTSVLIVSAFMVLEDTLRLGELVAIFQLTGMLVPASVNIAMTNVQLQEARVAFDRMYEFTSIEAEYDASEEASKLMPSKFHSLEIRNLSFRYPGRRSLLRDVSLDVMRGRMIAVVGASGCGKTTLLQILQRLYQPEGGNIFVNDDQHWNDISTQAWRRLIGVVPQSVKIFNATVAENISLAAARAGEVALRCEEVGLGAYFRALPHGYDTMLGEEGVNLSGGQRQLLGLARALYRRPQLLLLDEPTSSMDRDTEAAILDVLERQRKEMGILLVTHRLSPVRHADYAYVIEDGRIHSKGTPEILVRGHNFFARAEAERETPR